MTRAARDDLISWAKRRAVPVASCVAARIRPDHLIGDATRKELLALVLVLAEAADPVTLRAVVGASEDGPDITDEDVRLLKAHAHAEALRKAGMPLPVQVRALDSEYRRRRKAAAAEAAAAEAGAEQAA